MTETQSCPKCGHTIPSGAPSGICPKCLMQAGMESEGKSHNSDTGNTVGHKASKIDQPSKQFGAYELFEEIARGGMGVVYRARQKSLTREVALKMIINGRFASETEVQRFRHEAESAAKLDHPGIVPIYETGEHEGFHFFSMKLIEGGSLADQIGDLTSEPRRAAALLSEVARAVHHAHQRGILHRDLKPANILIDKEGKPLVSDLGLARNIQSESGVTKTGAVLGTPAYMPPEQAAGNKEITTAADIYSLGAILYEALTGKQPYRGDSPMQTLMKVMEESPRPARSLNTSIDPTLELICMKCLERDPDDRYSSAAALADDLEAWIADEPVSVRPPSLGGLVVSALRTNLKSALGAALIGLVIGGVFTWCAISGLATGGFRWIGTISQRFPNEPQPTLFNSVRDFAIASPGQLLLYTVLILIVFFLIGMLNVWLIRPKRGAPSFAVGTVCGLVMTATIYFSTGFIGVCHFGPNQMSYDIRDLAHVAFSESAEQDKARQRLLTRHPDVMDRPVKYRGRDFGQLVYDRGVTGIPAGIALGMTLAALLGMLPSILGTTFASRVMHEEQPRKAWLLYTELMVALAVLIFGVVFQMMIGLRGDAFTGYNYEGVYTWRSWVPGLLVGSFAVYAVYNRWDWRLRLVLFMVAIAARNAFE